MWKSILARINNVFKSNAIAAIDSIEDPVKMYELAVQESEENMNNMTKALSVALGDQKNKERQLQQFTLETESWHQKAKISLAQGNSELAKTALEHKAISTKKVEEYSAITQMLNAKIEEQKKQLSRMKLKHEELKAKKSVFSAKYETAKAQKQMAASLGGLNNSALSQVSRMEEKIYKLESESEALLELTEDNTSTDRKFEDMATNAKVEDDLQQLQLELAKEEEIKNQKKLKIIEQELSKSDNQHNKNVLKQFYNNPPKKLEELNQPKKDNGKDDKNNIIDDFFKKK